MKGKDEFQFLRVQLCNALESVDRLVAHVDPPPVHGPRPIDAALKRVGELGDRLQQRVEDLVELTDRLEERLYALEQKERSP